MNWTTTSRGVITYVATGDETPAEGSVCDNLDTELPRHLQESDRFILDVQGEWGIFNLDGRDRMDRMCPAKGRNRDLAESDVFNLSSPTRGKGSCLRITEGIITHLTSSAIAVTVCSIGTVGSARCA